MIAAKITRSAGSATLFLASMATMVLLAFHPRIKPASTMQMLQLLADGDLGGQAAFVHGALVGVLGLLTYGLIDLSRVLGLRRTPVVFGLAAYAMGVAAVVIAMLFDGFITSQVAAVLLQKMATPAAAPGIVGAAPSVFALVSVTIQVFTKAGFVAMGAGMCFLSGSAFTRSPAFGWLGVPGGLLPATFTAASGIWLGPHQLILIALCQAVWYVGAALFLLRERRRGNCN